MKKLTALFLILCFILSPINVSAFGAPDLAVQRSMFLHAEAALRSGHKLLFWTLSNQLRDYPLYPYLVYEDLIRKFPQVSEKQITNFLQQYPNTLLADKLRTAWLLNLAIQKNWPLFLKYYQETDNIALQCAHLQALLNTNQAPTAFQLMPDLWLSRTIQPANCEIAFGLWHQAKGLTPELLWQRIHLAMTSNNMALAQGLKTWANSSQIATLQLWEKVVRQPTLVAQPALFQPRSMAMADVLIDGYTRWAKINAQQAASVWTQQKSAYGLPDDKQQAIQQVIALGLARNDDPLALNWLASIKPAYTNQKTREWRVRLSLLQQNWPQVRYWISQLTPEERTANVWRYWSARALAVSGQTKAAEEIYRQLANRVDFYGLLASQQLRQGYKPINRLSQFNPAEIEHVAYMPDIEYARELYALHRIPEARREWQWAMNQLNAQQLQVAALLAYQWHWYDRAIVSLAKAQDWNNVTLRFPTAYLAEVKAAAHHSGVDPAWILAIMRQESTFIHDAKSGAGAVGLMQLMPHTAKILAKTNVPNCKLLQCQLNITLGSRYLKQLETSYSGNIIMATAAYNLGPTRLRKWLPLYKTVPADIWIEVLPWQETRDYVKAVLLNRAIYSNLV